jgi:hypothetical protein
LASEKRRKNSEIRRFFVPSALHSKLRESSFVATIFAPTRLWGAW